METPAPDIGAQIQTLRQERLDGKVSDAQFHTRMSDLGPWTKPLAR